MPTDYNRPGDLTKLGHGLAANVANVVTALPGTMAATSYLYGKLNHEPYDQARQEIEAVKQSVPAPLRVAETIAGSAPLALIPGSPAIVAAGTAAADQLANADPNVGVKARIGRAAVAAPIGGLVGKVGDMAVTKARSMLTPTLGAQQVTREANLAKTDADLFGKAHAEGRAAGMNPPMTPASQAAFSDPTVMQYVQMAATNPKNQGQPPSEIMMHAYRFMSRQQGGILQKIAQKGEYDAVLEDQADRLAASKAKLRDAITQLAPTFPQANAAHATAMGEQGAAERASDVAKRVFQDSHIAGRRIKTQAPEIFERDAASAPVGQQEAAAQSVLGRLKEFPTVAHAGRIPIPLLPSRALLRAPALMRATSAPSQGMIDLLTKLGVAGATNAGGPP